MQYLSIQQLSSRFGEKKCIGDRLVILTEEDLSELSGCRFLGNRMMVLVLRGRLEIYINDTLFRAEKYDFADVMEGTTVRFGEMDPGTEVYCIFTTRSFLMDSMQGIAPDPEDYVFKVLLNPVLKLEASGAELMGRHASCISEIVGNTGHRYRQEMVKLYLKAFALEFSNTLSMTEDDSLTFRRLNKREVLMASFIALVWKHLTESREVSFYAQKLCVTPKHLSRVVKETTGKSPHEIIAKETLSLAIQLLQNSSFLVQQVSDMLHFSDQAAFSKFFKKYIGMSPVEYRRENCG